MPQLDDFVRQVNSLPTMIGPSVDSLEPATRRILSTPEIYGVRQIILAGSGDSYFAGAATVNAFRDLTGLPVQAMPSMEASRYAGIPAKAVSHARGTLLIPVSYSGEAARTIEAAHRWRDGGAVTLGLTGNIGSRLASAVEHVVDTRVEEVAPAPGTRSYVVALIALNLLAIRLAEVLMRITMDEANRMRRELGAIGMQLTDTAARLSAPLRTFAEQSHSAQSFDVLGSGPSLGAAGYCAAKLVEAAGVHAMAQDCEEFFHLNYFVDHPATIPTVLFAPAEGAAASRARDLIENLRRLGRPLLVITDQAGFASGAVELPLPQVREWFVPIVQTVPAALLGAYVAEARGCAHYRGHGGVWSGARGAGLVRNSPIDRNRG
jgi:glucosamine--fructose-6-phosphate aminotransferase (isomerizing)